MLDCSEPATFFFPARLERNALLIVKSVICGIVVESSDGVYRQTDGQMDVQKPQTKD